MLRTLLRPACRDGVRAAVLLCAAVALIACPQQSIQAARQGLSLCAETIVPSLFPFFVLSGMVVELDLAKYLGKALERVMWPLFRVGGAGASALVLGLVGGYPVGARTAIDLYEKGDCSRAETERLLAFCNNSGPAFIFGVVGAGVFGSGRVGVMLYLAHVMASLCVGLVFRFHRGGEERTSTPPARHSVRAVRFSTAFTNSVRSAATGVVNICAFVVVFAVIIRLLALSGIMSGAVRTLTLLLMPLGMDGQQVQQLLTGLLEVSSGVGGLAGERQLALAAFMLGWAGLSVHCQVLCFLVDSGLGAGTYLVGKALHGVLSAMLVAGMGRWFPAAQPAGSWLPQQLERMTGFGFMPTFTLSVAAAWLLWLVFLNLTAHSLKKGWKRTLKCGIIKKNLCRRG